MNNKDKLNDAFNQIHAPKDLKEKTFEKMTNKKKDRFVSTKLISVAAVCLIIFTVGFSFMNKGNIVNNSNNIIEIATMDEINKSLPRFKDMQELIDVLKENENKYAYTSKGIDMIAEDAIAVEDADTINSEKSTMTSETSKTIASDYSETNNQVKNVDEADIVKTDGKNIYYVSNGIVYIVNSENLQLLSKIKGYRDEEKNEVYTPYNIFINDEKLVIIGNYNKYETITSSTNTNSDTEDISIDRVNLNYKNLTKACVYDLTNLKEPKLEREVCLDGYYKDARMIKDNIYFISTKSTGYFYNIDELKEEDILPIVSDSIAKEETKYIECTDIAYFPGTSSYTFMLIGGFNINNNSPVKVETIFGASDTIYCSEKNLYLTENLYSRNYDDSKIAIYKFELNDSNVVLKAKTEIKGSLNNQFSMDEYEGNLRIAVTELVNNSILDEAIEILTDGYIEEKTENKLYVLDENLEEIGKLDKIAIGERIYAVRFLGEIGYIVTFEQIDPLFVIDLSDPKNPEIKGELKIPGYSSYLHPYDETHIIGIGYNTKDNGYGGTTNTNMKMSMFDVSNLDNPKEMFSIDIGENWAYSDIIHDHKALFYKASEDLIGLPYTSYSYNGKDYWNFEIFHIDLENGFERFCNFKNNYDYKTNIKRMIYIDDIIYGLAGEKITSYNLNTGELIYELELDSYNDNYFEILY